MSCVVGFITPSRVCSAVLKSTEPPIALRMQASRFEQHTIGRENPNAQKPASTSLGVKLFPWQPASPPPAPDTHFAVSAATCSPTPRNAAISSMDSSWQLRQGAKTWSIQVKATQNQSNESMLAGQVWR